MFYIFRDFNNKKIWNTTDSLMLGHHILNIVDISNQKEVWLVGFYGISTFVGYLTPNLLCKSLLFKAIHSLFVKNISISNYSSSYI